MLYDVLTWVVHGGELYVSIIFIHGMLMLLVNIYMHALYINMNYYENGKMHSYAPGQPRIIGVSA